jgi:hypothetical protein
VRFAGCGAHGVSCGVETLKVRGFALRAGCRDRGFCVEDVESAFEVTLRV